MSQQVLTAVQLNQLPLQTKLQLIQSAKAEAESLQHSIVDVKRKLRDTTRTSAATWPTNLN